VEASVVNDVNKVPSSGVVSVKVKTFATPTSVSSKRCSLIGASLGGFVSEMTSPTLK